MKNKVIIMICLLALPFVVHAEGAPTLYETQDSFENVTFVIESAIVDAGLVIEHISHTGDMLERTREDMGSDKVIFSNADITILLCKREPLGYGG